MAYSKEEQKEYARNHYLKNKEKYIERAKSRYLSNKEGKAEYDKEYRAKNKDKINTKKSAYRKSSGKAGIWQAERRARKYSTNLLKGDEWNDFFIKEIYELRYLRSKETGIEWHVDHIIPLQGEVVSGFHVWYNLQLITAFHNISKSNSFRTKEVKCIITL